MKFITKNIARLDAFQRRHHFTGFTYAVLKKYSEDQAGYQAALLTYYGFLSLFPLLLVLTTLVAILAPNHPHLQQQVISGTTSYFPIFGKQLSDYVNGLHRSGFALIVGLLFTLYGARGVADAFRNGVNHVWGIPRKQRLGWPHSLLNSLAIIGVGGVGLIGASVATGLMSVAGHALIFKVAAAIVNAFILFWLFQTLLNLSLPKHISLRETRSAALTAAIALVILQATGGVLLKHELKNLDALYSYFAVALGLLFWIYLQAQVLYYSVEIAAVHSGQLWPRSLSGHNTTAADERAHHTHVSQMTR